MAHAFTLRTSADFRYVDEGAPSDFPPLVLLHGMLGDLSNWTHTVEALTGAGYRVLVPVLPVYTLPLDQTSVTGLLAHTRRFVEKLGLGRTVLIGNSLGGHVALLYAIQHPDAVAALALSGASGLYENSLGSSTPRRYDRGFIREKAALTFYDPALVTDDLVEEMYEIVTDRARVTRLIRMARATKQETVTDRLGRVAAPVLLVWGCDDLITPPEVAHEFRRRLPDAELHFLERCGHAPMIEYPDRFNELLLDFLRRRVG